MSKIATAKQIVAFWKQAGPEHWFAKDAAFDQKIREKFLVTHQAAEMGKLEAWEQGAEGALALLLLFDQFPRNMFRGTPRAFANDEAARAIATRAIRQGFDQKMPVALRAFFYLPFEHSEAVADQQRSVRLFEAMQDQDLLHWAKVHLDIIERFGRFPHRNVILQRSSTLEEARFLEDGGFGG